MAELPSRWDIVNGWRMFSRFEARSAPEGRVPLVFVHGLAMSSLYMLPLARRLAGDFPVYLPELPGYGGSEKPQKPLDLDALAEALCGYLDQQGIRRAALLGNSLGCQIIVRFCLRYPDRAHKIILIGPTMDPAAPNHLLQFTRGAVNMLFEPLHFYPIMFKDYFRAGIRATATALTYGLEDDMAAHLPWVEAPALVIRGQRDCIVSQGWAERVARYLPNARLEVIPKAAHVANYDAAESLAPLVRAFLR